MLYFGYDTFDVDLDNINKFEKLTYLGIPGIGLTEFPHLTLPELEWLDISDNDLSSAAVDSVTGLLPLLETLYMTDCSLSAIPDLSAFANTLTELALDRNPLKQIRRHDLCQLPQLQTLRLNDINLKNIPCACSLLPVAGLGQNEFTELPPIASCAKQVHISYSAITHIRGTHAATLRKLNKLGILHNPLERLEDFLNLENNPSATLDEVLSYFLST